MNITLTPGSLSGSVEIIASKSQVHRLLICSALSKTSVLVLCNESSEDIEATVRCLNAIGAEIKKVNSGFYVNPIKQVNKTAVLDCGESGSTLRFLLPVIGALGIDAKILLSGRLPYRPLSPLWKELCTHGMVLSKPADNIIECGGSLKAGEYTIAGNISSQFISGLLFSLPILKGESIITITGKTESEKYIDMTRDALLKFGIRTEYSKNKLSFPGNMIYNYRKKEPLFAEGDWSNAAFWLCAGALSENEIICNNLNLNSLQGDKEIIKILKSFGADVITEENSVKVKDSDLKGIDIDAADIPDLVPVLAVCACKAFGTTKIYNAGRLKLKESDRLFAVCDMLSNLGADITETDDGLIICGKGKLSGGTVSSFGDHRIAMSAAIASIICENEVTVTGAEAVNKSYPKFWEHFENLGGRIIRGE